MLPVTSSIDTHLSIVNAIQKHYFGVAQETYPHSKKTVDTVDWELFDAKVFSPITFNAENLKQAKYFLQRIIKRAPEPHN